MDLKALDKTLPQIISCSKTQVSQIFNIESCELLFSNGVKSRYERLKAKNGAVMCVPYDGKDFILTSEYAFALNRYELSLVKGKIDDGEDHQAAALRELQEEIGLGSRRMTLLKDEITLAPGMLELRMYIYLCEDLYSSKLQGDEPEEIDMIKVSVAEAKDLIFDPHSPLKEARAIAALTFALHKLGFMH